MTARRAPARRWGAADPSPIIRTWDSLSDAIAHAETYNGPRGTQASREAGASFTGTESWDAMKQLIANGYHDVRPIMDTTIDSIASDLRDDALTMVPSYRWDVSGGEVNVDYYLAGEPECMRECVLTEAVKYGRTVKVCVKAAVSAKVPKDEILQRGAVVCALVQALSMCGIGVEVWSSCNGSGWDGAIKLSSASDPMDIDAMAFALAHPSMLRRVFFGVMETEDDRERLNAVQGSGYAGDKATFGPWQAWDSAAFFAQMSFDVVIGQTDADVAGIKGRFDHRNGAQWVRDTITGLGVTMGNGEVNG